jgi:hypothetical protein
VFISHTDVLWRNDLWRKDLAQGFWGALSLQFREKRIARAGGGWRTERLPFDRQGKPAGAQLV